MTHFMEKLGYHCIFLYSFLFFMNKVIRFVIYVASVTYYSFITIINFVSLEFIVQFLDEYLRNVAG